MLLVGSACSNDRMVSAGLEALDWLQETQRCETNGHFVPIGSQGFYRQGGERARFDQQPIEAAGAVSACLQAYRITGDSRWRNEAWSAFNWFLGDNDSDTPMVDPATGAPSPALAARMLEETRERGLLIGKGGLYGHALRMAPPLNVTETEASEGLGILTDALRAVNAQATGGTK